MKILITGCAGFIGFHLCNRLLESTDNRIYGIDNLNSYYDLKLKNDRLKILKKNKKKFIFYKMNIENTKLVGNNFKKNKYDIVINLAAQAGVRYSVNNPKAYLDSNILGYFNIINFSRINKIKHFIYASSSSVYGEQKQLPFKEDFRTDSPISFYAATKKCNEILAFSYSSIYNLTTTGIRFFTVYGPMGRPDMAIYKFTDSIIKNKKIQLFNEGKNYRDFTYIDDVINAVEKIILKIPKNKVPHQIINIGYGEKIKTLTLLSIIEDKLNKKARIVKIPAQLGDVKNTLASQNALKKNYRIAPKISIEKGISKYIRWFRQYYLC